MRETIDRLASEPISSDIKKPSNVSFGEKLYHFLDPLHDKIASGIITYDITSVGGYVLDYFYLGGTYGAFIGKALATFNSFAAVVVGVNILLDRKYSPKRKGNEQP